MLPYHGEVGGGHFVAERKGLLEFVVGGQSVFVRGRRGRERVAGYVCKVSKFIRDSQVFCDIFFEGQLWGHRKLRTSKRGSSWLRLRLQLDFPKVHFEG